uniref:Putative secreted protein n=1 Tax=Anopheles darlingi TaxID=43151 RepID=A0A2M4D8G3_ANODA
MLGFLPQISVLFVADIRSVVSARLSLITVAVVAAQIIQSITSLSSKVKRILQCLLEGLLRFTYSTLHFLLI